MASPRASSAGPKAIACSECRKRKQRCNRKTPCEECIRRGHPHLCQPDYRKMGPSNAALSLEVRDHKRRLEMLETFISSQFPAFSTTASEAQDSPLSAPPSSENPGLFPYENGLGQQGAVSMAQIEGSHQGETSLELDLGAVLSTFKDFDLFSPSSSDSNGAASSPSVLFPSIRVTSVHYQAFGWTQHLMQHLLSLLPPPAIVRTLVGFYLGCEFRSVHSISNRQFYTELLEFEQLRQANLSHEVDPAWLSLLFMVMSAGLVSEYEVRGHIIGADRPEEVFTLVDNFASCAQGALAAANWATTPNLRVVQTLAVLAWWSQHNDVKASTFERDADYQAYRVAIALQHCQKFGLDKLGNDPNKMPSPDPAFGSSHSGFRRQMALRLWHDYKMMESLAGCYLVDRKASNTALAAACREEDLDWNVHITERTVTEEPTVIYLQLRQTLSDHLSWFHALRSNKAATLQDFDDIAKHLEKQMKGHLTALDTVPNFAGPNVLESRESYLTFLRMNLTGGRLRIWRAGMSRFQDRANEHAICEKRATQAAINTVACLTQPAAVSVLRCMPFAVAFLLNACVLLTTSLVKETNEVTITMHLNSLKAAAEVFRVTGRQSRMRSIVANANRASIVMSTFAHKLQELDSARSGPLAGFLEDIRGLATPDPPPPSSAAPLASLFPGPALYHPASLPVESSSSQPFSFASEFLLEGIDYNLDFDVSAPYGAL